MTRQALLATATAALLAFPSTSTAKSEPLHSAAQADWYFVDEIITDAPPDYRSEIYFANKASIARDGERVSLAISRIILTDWENRSQEENIRDMRSIMMIDCRTLSYSLLDRLVFDGAARPVDSGEPGEPKKDPGRPGNGRGFNALVQFACTTDGKVGERQSPADMQPLTWLITYMNADWSK